MARPVPITGSMLHDLVACERRVHHDIHTDPAGRDPVSEFVRMLWSGGRTHEAEVLAGLEADGVVDLRDTPVATRAAATAAAMVGDAKTILGGRLEQGDLVGMPDMLHRSAHGWVAGDVKSGGPFEPGGQRPRKAYAVQVALYTSLIAAAEAGTDDTAFVVGRNGERVDYDLTAEWERSGRSIADMTAALVDQARGIRDGVVGTRGAASAACKMCHWHSVCARELADADDLTLIAGVGRAARDALLPTAGTVLSLAGLDIDGPGPDGKALRVPGLGPDRLRRFRDRARLLSTPGSTPYAIRPLGLTAGHREIHFDIETDPSRDGFVYLHGFLFRESGQPDGRYVPVFAETQAGERDAFAQAVRMLSDDPDAMVYYYSKFERSSFRQLQARHPDVCSEADIEAIFDPARAIDLLFDVVMPHTEWPTASLGLKALARCLGFEWRDSQAGGANSIAWFDEYARTGDPAVKRRILAYNADDVRASAVVLDGLRSLPVRDPPSWPPG